MNLLDNVCVDYLLEGRLLKDYRTDKSHYFAFGTTLSSFPRSGPSNDGGFVLLPVGRIGPLDQLVKKDFPTEEGEELPKKAKHDYGPSRAWKSRSIYNSPCFEVNHEAKTLNVDLEGYFQHQHRRGDPNRTGVSWTILAPYPKIGENLLELKKLMVDVAKIDPAILDFTLAGITGKPQTVKQFISKPAPSVQVASGSSEPLVLYHGTSMNLWQKIKTQGLRPGLVSEVYGDLVPGYSEKNVYFEVSRMDAHNYAARAAINDKSAGAVLQVTIPDPAKLRPDEDTVGWLNNTPGWDKIAAANPDLANEASGIHFRHYKTWTSHPKAKIIYQQFMNAIRSLRGGSVAYQGFILPKHIKLVQTFKPYRMKKDPSDDEWNAAMAKTQASAKSYDDEADEMVDQALK